jgi:hypothetical protein
MPEHLLDAGHFALETHARRDRSSDARVSGAYSAALNPRARL